MPFWAVAKGRVEGIYTTWPEAHAQVNGFSGNVHKKFETLAEARAFIGWHAPICVGGGSRGRQSEVPLVSVPEGTSGLSMAERVARLERLVDVLMREIALLLDM
jgi:Caulimovirus viroplasmin